MAFQVCLFADGTPCPASLGKKLRKGRFTIALDGAAEQARREGWRPDLISGDLDTISPATLRHFERRGVAILPTPDQSFTDLEKALAWSALQEAKSIWIVGALGDRLDHSFTALSLLQRYHGAGRELRLFQKDECIRFLRNEKVSLSGQPGRRIALLPFPQATVTSQGLTYELDALDLSLGVKESVSNAARTRRVVLEIQGSALLTEAL